MFPESKVILRGNSANTQASRAREVFWFIKTSLNLSAFAFVSETIFSERYIKGGTQVEALPFWGEPQRAPQLRVDLDFRHCSRYIYIYKSSVRPLGLVPATIEPKSRANPVLRLCLLGSVPATIEPKSRANSVLRFCLPLALIDDDFLSKGCLCKSPDLCFSPHCIRCSASCPLRQARSGFFRQAYCPSLPVFQTQEIDDWRPKFPFRLWWPLID